MVRQLEPVFSMIIRLKGRWVCCFHPADKLWVGGLRLLLPPSSALNLHPELAAAIYEAKNTAKDTLQMTGSGSALFEVIEGKSARGRDSMRFPVLHNWERFIVSSSPMLHF